MAITCSRCVMDDSSNNGIVFDEHGCCSYCTDALHRMPYEYFPNDQGASRLRAMMAKVKNDGIGQEYDCVVGVSGGVDSSYLVYLGCKFELRMLAVHVDDGFDTDVAKANMENLCTTAGVKLVQIRPNPEQYRDLTLSLFKASVPNLAIGQDNIIVATLDRIARQTRVKYLLSGANFALECILERRGHGVNAFDATHIREIHRRFGSMPIDELSMTTLTQRYILSRYLSRVKKLYPLNYIQYDLEKCLAELKAFSQYTYYGGKHYESILTRFLQCYYLPVKYGFDKRKSHLSSMIVTGQISREQALARLSQDPYVSKEVRDSDIEYIAEYLRLSRSEFENLITSPPKEHSDYSMSILNNYANWARRLRRYLG